MFAPVMEGAPVSSCAAHAVVLQLPLEGMLQGGGISAVLKRPAGIHPEWLTQDHGRNFYVSFAEVGPPVKHLCSNNQFCVCGLPLVWFYMHIVGRGQHKPLARIGYVGRYAMLVQVALGLYLIKDAAQATGHRHPISV